MRRLITPLWILVLVFSWSFQVTADISKPKPTQHKIWKIGDRIVPGPLPPNIMLPEPTLDRWLNVTYGINGGIQLKLDVNKPVICRGEAVPLVVYFHGGGWRTGNRQGLYNIRHEQTMFYQMGFAVATVEYRLTPKFIHPSQINDCKLAIRFLRKNATKYGIDPKRIGVWGHSAGGHLVALIGTADDGDGLEGPGLPGISSRPQVVLELYGPTDLTQPVGEVGWEGITEQLLGCKPLRCLEKAKQASPVTYATVDDPPMLIIHGDKDLAILYLQGELFAKKLKEVGVSVALIKVKNGGHLFAVSGGPLSPTIARINFLYVAQMARYLEPGFFGDLNLDGQLDLRDMLEMVNLVGTQGTDLSAKPAPEDWNPLADLISDGIIDLKDLTMMIGTFLKPK